MQRELSVWAARLDVAQPALEDELFALATGYQDARRALLAPFEPYLDASGIRESWLMFSAGTVESDRFGVRMRRCTSEACPWETLYVHGDPSHAWRASQLGHPRVRSMIFRWGWPSYRGAYEPGCEAIARLAFEDFPDARQIECRFERTTLHSPTDPDPPPPVWERAIRVRRP